MFVNLNGSLLPAAEARVAVLDHGLLYGDGLFETLRVYGGRFFRLEAHLDRLLGDAVRLHMALPWGRGLLAEALRETAAANGLGDGALRLTVTRGEGLPLPDPAVCAAPTFFVTARSGVLPGDEAFERGTTVCVAGVHPRWAVPGIKSLCYLPFQQARVTARGRGCEEGLLFCEDCLVESSTGNLFLVRGGELVTPDLESGCLPGITRAAVLEACKALGIRCQEGPVPVAWLAESDEAFLTGSLAEVTPVLAVEGQPVGSGCPGPLTRRVREEYRRMVQRELLS